jgi:hypothetical protein
VTKRKKHTTTVGMIPGLLVGNESTSSSTGQGLETPKRTRLRLFRLNNSNEQAALNKLSLQVRSKRGFRRLVRAHLQLIADTVSHGVDKKQSPVTPSTVLRDLERRAQSVRNFAERIERPLAQMPDGIGFIEPLAPVRELYRYADYLDACADRRRSDLRKHPPPHRPRPEKRLIVSLAEFVRRTTGSPHWNSLSLLLKRPTGDCGFNGSRLSELVRFHKAKARNSRRYSILWFPPG